AANTIAHRRATAYALPDQDTATWTAFDRREHRPVQGHPVAIDERRRRGSSAERVLRAESDERQRDHRPRLTPEDRVRPASWIAAGVTAGSRCLRDVLPP